jgi:AcrR family transcriptional regulator
LGGRYLNNRPCRVLHRLVGFYYANVKSPAVARRRQERRKELMEVAATVFAERGIASSTVRDIAERAEIWSGSLYHHFESKDQIVAEVVRAGMDEWTAYQATTIASNDGDAAATLRALIVGSIHWVAEHPSVATILSNECRYLQENVLLADVNALYVKNRHGWIRVIKNGKKAGTFRKDANADVVVRAIFDSTMAAARWLPPVRQEKPKAVGGQLADLYVRGLMA